jgi:sirohydrochlorin cobaltochelatase
MLANVARERIVGEIAGKRGLFVRMSLDDRRALSTVELRLRIILPKEYQDTYEDLQPAPMRSAGLKYRPDGTVAWNEIWGSFCDLAMAGGPPHKGKLLEPGSPAAIAADPERYEEVAEEICRGVRMTTDLDAEPSPTPGWVRVLGLSDGMAGWLLRAIVMENVAVHRDGVTLDLPAAPHFRLEKEIKNVVTVIAKTSHYWLGHLPPGQQRAITNLFARMTQESPLVVPALNDEPANAHEHLRRTIGDAIQQATGLRPSPHGYTGWLGVECPSVRAAIWMMRALVVSNVLSRREDTVIFVPIDPDRDPSGQIVAATFARVHRLAAAKDVL